MAGPAVINLPLYVIGVASLFSVLETKIAGGIDGTFVCVSVCVYVNVCVFSLINLRFKLLYYFTFIFI